MHMIIHTLICINLYARIQIFFSEDLLDNSFLPVGVQSISLVISLCDLKSLNFSREGVSGPSPPLSRSWHVTDYIHV